MSWYAPRIVQRYAAECGASLDESEQCFTAFKQFMVVCGSADDERAPSREVDEMWHTALLFTRSYHAFCERHLGRHVHHEPVEDGVDISVYEATREDAAAVFGSGLNARYWPTPGSGPCAGSVYVP